MAGCNLHSKPVGGCSNCSCYHGSHFICTNGTCEYCAAPANFKDCEGKYPEKVQCNHGVHNICLTGDVCCYGTLTCDGPEGPPQPESKGEAWLPTSIDKMHQMQTEAMGMSGWPKYMVPCIICRAGLCEDGENIKAGRAVSREAVMLHSLYACQRSVMSANAEFICEQKRMGDANKSQAGWHVGPHMYRMWHWEGGGKPFKLNSAAAYVQKAMLQFGAEQVKVAVRAGLDMSLDLPAEVADFYLLERMVTDNQHIEWGLGGEGRDGTMWKVPSAPPDSSRELFQLGIIKQWDEKVRKLSVEFATYIGMACGGELRYAITNEASFMGGGECEDYHDHGSDCYGCYHEDEPCDENCCTADEHEHTIECYKHTELCTNKNGGSVDEGDECFCKVKRVVGGEKFKECGEDEHSHEDGECEDSCGHDCWAGSCKDEPACGEEEHCCEGDCSWDGEWQVQPPGELKEYFERVDGRGDRHSAWDIWMEFHEEYGPEATLWMAEMFEMDHWPRDSIGGAKWGACARLVYDYEVGNIKPRTFIDQCWTMEHNGGCIFNKVYLSGQDQGALLNVLEVQHSQPYDELARHSRVASDWARSSREMRRGGRYQR